MPQSKKKAAAGTGSIRKKTRTKNDKTYISWEGRVFLGTDPITGKPRQQSVYGHTQKETVEKMQKLIQEVASGTYTAPIKMTVGEWLDIWLDQYLGGVKPRTVAQYAQAVRLYLAPTFGAIKLDKLKTADIQALYTALQRRDKPLSPKSIKNVHGVFHKALQQAMELGYIRSNPSGPCKLPRVEQKPIEPLDSSEIKALLGAAQGHRFENLFLTTLFTGMREGEVLGLMWECVDFTKGTILIRQQLQRNPKEWGGFMFTSPKNGKTRKITPAPFVMEALKRQKLHQEIEKKAAGELWEETGLVFTNEIGQNLSPLTVYKNFKKLVEEIGCPSARFHDLRHSYAVASLQAGDDIKTVQENLGHHTAAFTLEVYGHVTDEMKQASANRMDAFIRGLKTD